MLASDQLANLQGKFLQRPLTGASDPAKAVLAQTPGRWHFSWISGAFFSAFQLTLSWLKLRTEEVPGPADHLHLPLLVPSLCLCPLSVRITSRPPIRPTLKAKHNTPVPAQLQVVPFPFSLTHSVFLLSLAPKHRAEHLDQMPCYGITKVTALLLQCSHPCGPQSNPSLRPFHFLLFYYVQHLT